MGPALLEMWKHAAILPVVAVLAGCGTNSSDPLTRLDRLAAMQADLGRTTSIAYLDSLNGTFDYSGYGSVTFTGNVDARYPDAMAEVDVTADFSASGEDFVSGSIHSLEALTGQGRADDPDRYEGRLVLSREPISGSSVNGTYAGGLRLVQTTGTTTFDTGGIYSMTFRDSSAGQPAEYLEGSLSGFAAPIPTGDDPDPNMSGYFIVQR